MTTYRKWLVRIVLPTGIVLENHPTLATHEGCLSLAKMLVRDASPFVHFGECTVTIGPYRGEKESLTRQAE